MLTCELRGLADDLHAAGLRSLLALNHLELDLGALLEDGAARVVGVDENVLAAALRRDEPKTLSCVEELDGTFLHCFSLAGFPDRDASCSIALSRTTIFRTSLSTAHPGALQGFPSRRSRGRCAHHERQVIAPARHEVGEQLPRVPVPPVPVSRRDRVQDPRALVDGLEALDVE